MLQIDRPPGAAGEAQAAPARPSTADVPEHLFRALEAALPEARFENGLTQIEAGDIAGGRETFEQLLREAGASPPAPLLLDERSRSRAARLVHRGVHDAAA